MIKKIAPRGDAIIRDDENYMAWLSPFPNTPGFTVVIPKKHYPSDVLAMPDNDLQKFIIIAKKVAQLIESKLNDVGRVGLILEGTGIDHAHIKLVPMHGTGHMKEGIWKQYLSEKQNFSKKYEGHICSHDGPRMDDEELQKWKNIILG